MSRRRRNPLEVMIAIIGYTLGTLIGVLWWVAVIKLTQHIFF